MDEGNFIACALNSGGRSSASQDFPAADRPTKVLIYANRALGLISSSGLADTSTAYVLLNLLGVVKTTKSLHNLYLRALTPVLAFASNG
jgi:hypothetical protein